MTYYLVDLSFSDATLLMNSEREPYFNTRSILLPSKIGKNTYYKHNDVFTISSQEDIVYLDKLISTGNFPFIRKLTENNDDSNIVNLEISENLYILTANSGKSNNDIFRYEYQWQYNSGDGFENIDLATSQTFTIIEDSYPHRCIIKVFTNNGEEFTFTSDEYQVDINGWNFILEIPSDDISINFTIFGENGSDLDVDWGDGTVENYVDAEIIEHTYSSGTYKVNISGEFATSDSSILLGEEGSGTYVTRIYSIADIQNFDLFETSFKNCQIEYITSSLFNYISTENEQIEINGVFEDCTKLKQIPETLFIPLIDKTININGAFLGCTSLESIPENLFRYNTIPTSSGFSNVFQGCISIKSIPEDLFRYNTNITTTAFTSTFQGCISLESIPENLFRYNTNITTSAFSSTFLDCTSLTEIPTGLFIYNTGITTNAFNSTFGRCTSLTEIPTDLFRYNTGVTTSAFTNTFLGCSSLTEIPENLFTYNTAITTNGFGTTFRDCTSLTSIPENLFRYNTSVSITAFFGTFHDCTSLTEIPTDLFRYNTSITTSAFNSTFRGCTSLTSLPIDLFRYNTGITTSAFTSTFNGCTSLSEISTDLFRYNTGITTGAFASTFNGCTSLSEIPTDLFRYNTGITTTGFNSTFASCTGLNNGTNAVPADTFRYQTNMAGTNSFSNVFQNVTLSTSDYNNLLVSLNTYLLQSNLGFGGGNSQYSGAGATARAALVSRGWVISDGGAA